LNGQNFDGHSTHFLAQSIWAVVGICGQGVADKTLAGSGERQHRSDSDVPGFQGIRHLNGRRCRRTSGGDESVTVSAKRTLTPQSKRWTAAQEKILLDCVEKDMTWRERVILLPITGNMVRHGEKS
jgi:hypothetical protein